MADAALFEFLHTEMVAELWAKEPDPDPDPAPGVSAGPQGEETRAGAGRQDRGPEECDGRGRLPGRTNPGPAPVSLGHLGHWLRPL